MEATSSMGGNLACLVEQKKCTALSVVSALENFLSSTEQMQNLVMVPSRLKDMTIAVGPIAGDEHGSAIIQTSSTETVDLYRLYKMLHCLRQELISGSSLEREPCLTRTDSEEEIDEQAAQMSAVFRQRIQGLFDILHQLSDAANYVSESYSVTLGN